MSGIIEQYVVRLGEHNCFSIELIEILQMVIDNNVSLNKIFITTENQLLPAYKGEMVMNP